MATRPDHALGAFIREQRELAGSSLRKPSAEILQQIAKGLRISAETLYVRAGILDEVGDERSAEAAILADHRLTERQKRVLLDICSSFRRENAETAAEPPAKAAARKPAKATATKPAKAPAAANPTTRIKATA